MIENRALQGYQGEARGRGESEMEMRMNIRGYIIGSIIICRCAS